MSDLYWANSVWLNGLWGVALLVVVLFFLAGGAVLWTVDEKEGIEAAQG